MNIVKKGFNYYFIEDMRKGFYCARRYFYYTKKEAVKMFNKEFKK